MGHTKISKFCYIYVDTWVEKKWGLKIDKKEICALLHT